METSDEDNSSIGGQSSKSNDSNYTNLRRAISAISTNQILVQNQRNLLAKRYRRTHINDQIVTIDHNDADASFILPNLSELAGDIRFRVIDNLVDIPTMNYLEDHKRLNWWVNHKFSCPTLYPLNTSGDGNCLLHATSLAMWGFHDHALSMRKALNDTLVTLKANSSLYRRWGWAQSIQNKKHHLMYSEAEWIAEWKTVLHLSSIESRNTPPKLFNSNQSKTGGSTAQFTRKVYHSLEEFHIYVLANIVRRPIIVYSETMLRSCNGEALSPIEFGGIYLPLEIPPEKCYKQPIFLTFDASHFSALVPMESNTKSKVTYRIPLIDLETLELLPIHFLIDPGSNFSWPIDEELSDEKIRRHSIGEEAEMKILEKYLNLSAEYSSPEHLLLPMTLPTELNDQAPVTNDLTSTDQKKSSGSSFNPFSKSFRHKIFEPFSSTKRIPLKHHHLSVINETSSTQQQKFSPPTDLNSNTLTIIFANFQPKRPQISEYMIRNYIEICIKEYHLKQTKYDPVFSSTNVQSSVYYRHHQMNTAVSQTSALTQDTEEKKNGIDDGDDEDMISISLEQFAKSESYAQRKFDQLTSNNLSKDSLESHGTVISNQSAPSPSTSSTKRHLVSTSDNDRSSQQKRL